MLSSAAARRPVDQPSVVIPNTVQVYCSPSAGVKRPTAAVRLDHRADRRREHEPGLLPVRLDRPARAPGACGDPPAPRPSPPAGECPELLLSELGLRSR